MLSIFVDLMGKLLRYLPEENNELAKNLLIPGWMFSVFYLVTAIVNIDTMPYGKLRERKDGYYGLAPWLGWMIQESPSLFVPVTAFLFSYGEGDVSLVKVFTMAPMVTHYFNRTFIFPMQIKSDKKVPVLMCISAFVFTFYNGLIQSHAILHNGPTSWNQLMGGLAIFSTGMFINIQSDQILINLRKGNETGYKIPQGGLFTWLSSPNYLGEILEWWGFFFMAWTQAALWFAVWSTLYLGSRAIKSHKFYREKFKEDYPNSRRALIPFIL